MYAGYLHRQTGTWLGSAALAAHALQVRHHRSNEQAPHLGLACACSPNKLCHLAWRPAAAQQAVQPAAGERCALITGTQSPNQPSIGMLVQMASCACDCACQAWSSPGSASMHVMAHLWQLEELATPSNQMKPAGPSMQHAAHLGHPVITGCTGGCSRSLPSCTGGAQKFCTWPRSAAAACRGSAASEGGRAVPPLWHLPLLLTVARGLNVRAITQARTSGV